jgi:hypothetical protein
LPTIKEGGDKRKKKPKNHHHQKNKKHPTSKTAKWYIMFALPSAFPIFGKIKTTPQD